MARYISNFLIFFQNGNGVTNGGAAALRPVSMVAGGGALSGSAAAANRPTSLMDRLSKLNQAQQQWQNKVEEKVNYILSWILRGRTVDNK